MGTVSLVTGGNRGIGREVCRQLAGRGHAVVLTARSPDHRDAVRLLSDAVRLLSGVARSPGAARSPGVTRNL